MGEKNSQAMAKLDTRKYAGKCVGFVDGKITFKSDNPEAVLKKLKTMKGNGNCVCSLHKTFSGNMMPLVFPYKEWIVKSGRTKEKAIRPIMNVSVGKNNKNLPTIS
jgi:hypothetical protein